MGLGEADTRAKLIDPALHARGWTEDLIRREETAGAIEIVDGRPRKQRKGRIDYLLRIKVNPTAQPVAVALIEAKAEDLPPAHGLEQGKLYAVCRRLNIPFVFSSNGHLFVEHDRFTGITKYPAALTTFPTPAELRARYEAGMGFSLEDPAARPLITRYAGGEATRRYYQDAAIRAVLEKIARCEHTGEPRRALLSLATGSGKTFIAVHLLKRIADAGLLRRALFVCDRDELRSQALAAFQGVFGADAAEVYREADDSNHARNARIHIATYQTLNVDTDEADATFLTTYYPENYFSHIIIDECHRSAWGKWSQVLTWNPNAVQIGLTATPRQLEVNERSKETAADEKLTADNLAHFGEPVYEYDVSQGIEDGYLAACEIAREDVFLDDKPQPERETGVERADLVDKVLTDPRTGERMSISAARARYNAEWCAKKGRRPAEPYAFKCTASVGGSDFLPDLRGASRHHFIATTVDLLTTGVDVPCVRNIVFFKYVRSPIAFYQMLGRGTRLDAPTGKLMFRVYDYTDATRLFGQDFRTKFRPPRRRGPGGEPEGPPEPPEPVLQVEGFDVRVTDAGRFILTTVDGRAVPVTVEEYKARLAASLVEEAPTLEGFRERWVSPPDRRDLLAKLPDAGRSALLVRSLENLEDYDLYDVLGDLAYGMAPRTRESRAAAFAYKHAAWLSALPKDAAATLKALAAQFGRTGTDGLENPQVFQTPAVARAGGLSALKALGKPAQILQQTKERLFAT